MPSPPYYAVIFSSQRASDDDVAYELAASRMLELAAEQEGYLGVESSRGQDGFGLTVSYWESLEAIRNWKQNAEHLEAQRLGQKRWYRSYRLQICRVESAIEFPAR